MCGIFCSISRHEHVVPSDTLKQLLQSRGPDASNQLNIQCIPESTTEPAYLTCYSTVLSLRGSNPVSQPYQQRGSNSFLCWNGEAWGIAGEKPTGNDTAAVFDALQNAVSIPVPPMDAREEGSLVTQTLSQALSQVAGPYALVFYDELRSRVYFGRDSLGRRSLLWRVSTNGDLIFSSITDGTPGQGWTEVDADAIYSIDLSARSYARDRAGDDVEQRGAFFVSRAPYSCVGDRDVNDHSVIPKLLLNRQIPRSPARLDEDSPSVSDLGKLLRNSLSARVLDIPEPPALDKDISWCRRAKVAILFSGGLDCTVLARLSHDLLPTEEPIDLLNVAFENPRIHKSAEEDACELCPDRITGRVSYAALCSACPGREWRFVAIDVPYSEARAHRQQIIRLMHPHNTEMDLSIAYALYFAARGVGCLYNEMASAVLSYTTAARVLLSGLGADELFAGYTRHSTAFTRHGHEGLLNELDLDIGRLGKRNLGRDDRVISHWGREVRFPFLDEHLVRWALEAPVTDKCDFDATKSNIPLDENSCASIEPGKKALRCLAWRLGMKEVAKEKKRAIQFGARTAKMETGKTKGTTLLS
ncbi:Asparagine synthetase domain-containing [Lecanosticta acicola]|uniref:Asparagine synthetase domain-containing n=1 Tax=Lecanosticta acicola TaxID=111012 RepID=A0AAI8Z7P8_9PEZI|nr:Asparagine synthetase domain-containing [Lecanosticta acicola]